MRRLLDALRHRGAGLPLGVLLLVFVALTAIPLPWDAAMEDLSYDILIGLRGGRSPSERIVYITFSEEDIAALGWPVTRDYYGYMVHVLSRSGAEVIGLYALFDSPGRHYPEFDRRLAEFLESSGNVCLPAALIPEGARILEPIPEFGGAAAAIGFSNLGEDAVARRIPVLAAMGGRILFSYGAELARLFLKSPEFEVAPDGVDLRADGRSVVVPLDDEGRLFVDYRGGADGFASMGFLEVLRAYETDPDSLDFSGRLVVVDAANPSSPVVKATPLTEALPAALVHAAAAETILSGRFLRVVSAVSRLPVLLLLVVAIALLWRVRRIALRLASLAGLAVVSLGCGLLLFVAGGWIVPLVYPALLAASAVLLLAVLDVRRLRAEASQNTAIQAMIAEKHAQLEEAETRLLETEAQLDEERQKKQDALLALDKQLRDLESYDFSPRQKPVRFQEIVHAPGSRMEEVLGLIEKVGGDDITVLILGETGTGKELVAKAIHHTSPRRRAPFVAINCGALPETLLESELFGHERGSFTGAQSRRRGRFEMAGGGTVFLDEITETTPAFQSRLLRVLQEKSFERVGGESPIQVDVRIVAASNRDLKEEVERGTFREDLYYRLTGFPIVIPPLRDRSEDIPVLARHFLKLHGYDTIRAFSDRAMDLLSGYAWPGNVRELENTVRRAAILTASESRVRIRASDLPPDVREHEDRAEGVLYRSLEEQILATLRSLKFSRSAIGQTARALGNRDRGTITEYFRGLCFQAIVDCDFGVGAAAERLAGTEDAEAVERVRTKMHEYVGNLRKAGTGQDAEETSAFRGLPKKYHPSLRRILDHLDSVE